MADFQLAHASIVLGTAHGKPFFRKAVPPKTTKVLSTVMPHLLPGGLPAPRVVPAPRARRRAVGVLRVPLVRRTASLASAVAAPAWSPRQNSGSDQCTVTCTAVPLAPA